MQDDQNVQNGSVLLRTAERGINQVIEELRSLKELAINSANDSNTDDDRRTIQKEFDSRIATIDEIALGTNYNGKILLDGRYGRMTFSVLLGQGGANTNFNSTISIGFSLRYNAVTASNNRNGGWGNWAFTADQSFAMSSKSGLNPWTWAKEWAAQGRGPANTVSTVQMAVELNFDNLQASMPFPECLHRQGFTILCGGCAQYINVIFDASISAQDSTYNQNFNEENWQAREFIIGVSGVNSPDKLPEAIFEGIHKHADVIGSGGDPNTSDNTAVDEYHDLRIARDPADPSRFVFLKGENLELQFLDGTVPNPMPTDFQSTRRPAIREDEKDPLWIQHGTLAGQRVNVYINSMQVKDIGLAGAAVNTRKHATATIGVIDQSLQYVLGQATTVGAWLNRLEYTDSNITTMSDNVTNSESTIRDADMAKEMTNYTKANVLSQAAQAMLAQANQNQSSILSLLQ